MPPTFLNAAEVCQVDACCAGELCARRARVFSQTANVVGKASVHAIGLPPGLRDLPLRGHQGSEATSPYAAITDFSLTFMACGNSSASWTG